MTWSKPHLHFPGTDYYLAACEQQFPSSNPGRNI